MTEQIDETVVILGNPLLFCVCGQLRAARDCPKCFQPMYMAKIVEWCDLTPKAE